MYDSHHSCEKTIQLSAKRSYLCSLSFHQRANFNFYCVAFLAIRPCYTKQLFLQLGTQQTVAKKKNSRLTHHFATTIVALRVARNVEQSSTFCNLKGFLFIIVALQFEEKLLRITWPIEQFSIGHFLVLLCLCFKTSLSAKPFIWKWILHAVSFSCKSKSFFINRGSREPRKWPINAK